MDEDNHLQLITELTKKHLALPTDDMAFVQHIANILTEEPPVNSQEIYELIVDFF